jgi:hypothetical protein
MINSCLCHTGLDSCSGFDRCSWNSWNSSGFFFSFPGLEVVTLGVRILLDYAGPGFGFVISTKTIVNVSLGSAIGNKIWVDMCPDRALLAHPWRDTS